MNIKPGFSKSKKMGLCSAEACSPAGSGSRGFTLIELIIAVFIFAVIGVVSATILSSVLDTNAVSERKSERLAELQRGLLFMTREVEQIVSRSVRDELGSKLAPVIGDEQILEFTRNGWSNPLPDVFVRSDMQRVRYSLEEGNVIREYWQVLDRAEDSLPLRSVFIPNIKHFALRYYDGKEQTWLSQWPPLDPDREADIPQVVEVLIESETYGQIRRLFSLVG